MTTTPLTLPGVAGAITVEQGFWSGTRFHLDGVRLQPRGVLRNRLELPTRHGPLVAKVKGGLFRAHPVLVVERVAHRTGPPTPRSLQVLAAAPFVGLLLVQGLLGALLAVVGTLTNQRIVRSERSHGSKLLLTSLTLVVVLGLELAFAVAYLATR